MGVPLLQKGIERIKNTAPQMSLNAKKRKKNIKGAFKIKIDLTDQNILIIDDVITTAQTVTECAKALKKSGAKKIIIASIAKTDF